MFTVVETKPPRYVIGSHTATSLADVQHFAALAAVQKLLKKPFFNNAPFRCWTTLSNLCDPKRGSTHDLKLIVATVTQWLDAVEPQFTAIEGKVGYNVRPGVHRLIKTDDGQEHGSREKAATHVLLKSLEVLRPTLTNGTVRALCNANFYHCHAGDESPYLFERGLRSLFATERNECDFTRARVEKMRDALAAIVAVREIEPRII